MPNSNPVKRVQLKVGQASAANLASLLPTGTVLAAQALIPSFTNNGECALANEYLTLGMIVCCSLACFLSSFTDSFTGKDGRYYYGIATWNDFWVFNVDRTDGAGLEEEINNKEYMAARRITAIDFVHAFTSLTVFLVFALNDSNVQKCFFPRAGANEKALIMNLPLGAGLLASLLFMLFPTTRRGIGYGDTPVKSDQKGEEHACSNKESA
ncbi:protein DMP [Salix suchowensis]|nr:protein DMP [Salix suchowensis]